jgi:hypothetical protein
MAVLIDIGPVGQSVQPGFIAYSFGTGENSAANNDVTPTPLVVTTLQSGFSQPFTVSFSPLDVRDRGLTNTGITGTFASLGRDGFKEFASNGSTAFTLTLAGLAAGTYEFTSYNHDAAAARNNTNLPLLTVTVGGATDAGDRTGFTQSGGSNLDSIATNIFNFTANGTDNVTLAFTAASTASGTGSTQEIFLNGFNLTAVPEPTAALSLLSGAAMLGMMRRRRA